MYGEYTTRRCLKINTALDFTLCCIYLSTRSLMLYFPYITRGGTLAIQYMDVMLIKSLQTIPGRTYQIKYTYH